MSNHLCIENTSICPVIKISFNSTDSPTSSNDYVLNFPNGKLIYSSNEKAFEINKINIPLQFKIANDQPCKNPFYENIPYSPYILDYYFGRNFCFSYVEDVNNSTFIYDNNYQIIDKYYQESLYNENGITTNVYKLPLFPMTQFKRDIK